MSTLDLSADEFRTLESLRQRLATLTSDLKSLSERMTHTNALPPPASLQATARITQQHLSSVQALLADRQDLFARLAVHPSTNYPGRTDGAEAMMQMLLRKRLEPDVETWVEKARDVAVEAGVDVPRIEGKEKAGEEDDEDEDDEGYKPEDDEDNASDPLADLWADVKHVMLPRIDEFVNEESQDVYTVLERELGVENVRTGLRRDLEDEEESEDEDEDDEGEGGGQTGNGAEDDDDVVMLGPGGAPAAQRAAKPQAPQAQQRVRTGFEAQHGMWFGMRGGVDLPRNIETESQRMVREAQERSKVR